MLHRTFAAAALEAEGEQPTFTFRGREFTCVPVGEVPAGVVLDMVAASQQRRGQPAGDAAGLVAGLLAFILSCLTEESAERFDELLHRPWTVKPLAEGEQPAAGWTVQEHDAGRRQVWRTVRDTELEELADWLAEVYVGVPTRPSSASWAESSPDGPSSRAPSSSVASAPTSSPQPFARVRDLETEARTARAAADAGASWTGPPDPSSTSA